MINTSQELYDNAVFKYRETKYTIIIYYKDGTEHELTEKDLASATIDEQISPISSAIYASTLNFSLLDPEEKYNPLSPGNDLKAFQNAEFFEVRIAVRDLRNDNGWIWSPGGRFYPESIIYKNSRLSITAYSAVKKISTQYFYQSKLYNDDITLKELVDLILAKTGFSYNLDSDFANLQVKGYIPYCSKLDALLAVAVAYGLIIKDSREGYISISRRTTENSANLIVTSETLYTTYPVTGQMICRSVRDNLPAALIVNNPQLIVIDSNVITGLNPTRGRQIRQLTISQVKLGTLEPEKVIYEGPVTFEEDYKVIDLGFPASVTSITGADSAEMYLCSVTVFAPAGQTRNIKVVGCPYNRSILKQTKELSSFGEVLELKKANTLQPYVDSIDFYSKKLNREFTFDFSWVSIPTVEAGDYVKIRTKYSSEYTVQIVKNKINLNGLISKIEAE